MMGATQTNKVSVEKTYTHACKYGNTVSCTVDITANLGRI